MSEFKFRYLKIVSEFRFQSTFPEIPASEFEIQMKINFSHNNIICFYGITKFESGIDKNDKILVFNTDNNYNTIYYNDLN